MERTKMHSWTLLLAMGVLAIAAGCAKPERPTPVEASDARVDEFFERVRSDTDHQWLENAGDAWLANLPPESQVLIAERALHDSDPELQTLGAQLFYALGMDERGDAAVADLAIQGVDVTGFGWGWMHSGEAGLLEKRMDGIRRILLSRYEQLTPEQRIRAEEILCEEGQACDLHAEAGKQSR